jgi:glycosyltransferase involved in cell wall biosynthesis
LSLERLAKDLGVQKHVVFFNRFVELEELMRFIGAADIYLTPYLTEAQITSGTLACAFGADWARLEAGTFRFRNPLNRERRFIPLRLDDAPIKGSLAQFLYTTHE